MITEHDKSDFDPKWHDGSNGIDSIPVESAMAADLGAHAVPIGRKEESWHYPQLI